MWLRAKGSWVAVALCENVGETHFLKSLRSHPNARFFILHGIVLPAGAFVCWDEIHYKKTSSVCWMFLDRAFFQLRNSSAEIVDFLVGFVDDLIGNPSPFINRIKTMIMFLELRFDV